MTRLLVTGLVAALLALSGCTPAGEPAVEPSSPASVPAMPGEDPAVSEPPVTCDDLDRRAARQLGMWRVDRLVPYVNTPDSVAARDELATLVDRIAGRLAETCGEEPPGFTAFAEVARAQAAEPRLDAAGFDAVLRAWLAWGEEVGAPQPAEGMIENRRACAERAPLVDATYALTSTPTDTGRMWFLDVTFDNRVGGVLDGSWSGEMQGEGVLSDPFGRGRGPTPGRGSDVLLGWGGSSADTLEVPPGTSTVRVAPDVDSDVHTTATGRLRVVDFSAVLTARGTRLACQVLVVPAD